VNNLLRRFLATGLTAALTLGVFAVPALADSTSDDPGFNPGVRIGTWLEKNVAAIFAPVLAIIAIYYLIKRQFTQFISFAVFAAIVALFVFAAGDFKDAALSFTRWILGR